MSDCIKDAKAQAKASSGTPDPAIKFAAERARCWLRVWRYLRGADPACQEEPLAASGAGPGGAGRGSVGQHQAVGVGSSESKAAGSSESKAGADGVPRLRSRWTALGRREIEEHAAAKFLFFDCDSDPRQLDTALFLTQTTAKSAGDIEFGAIALLAGLFSPSECVSRNCSYALGALSYRHPLLAAVVNELIFILASGGDAHFSLPPEVPVSALETAGGFESKPAYNRPAPKKNLTPHERARLHAAWALNQLGPVVSRVAPAALEAIAAAALNDPVLTVRREATEALGACAIAPPATSSASTRGHAGRQAQEVLSSLVDDDEDDDTGLTLWSSDAKLDSRTKQDAPSSPVVVALVKLLDDANAEVGQPPGLSCCCLPDPARVDLRSRWRPCCPCCACTSPVTTSRPRCRCSSGACSGNCSSATAAPGPTPPPTPRPTRASRRCLRPRSALRSARSGAPSWTRPSACSGATSSPPGESATRSSQGQCCVFLSLARRHPDALLVCRLAEHLLYLIANPRATSAEATRVAYAGSATPSKKNPQEVAAECARAGSSAGSAGAARM